MNHKDFNRQNNSLENLEWVTDSENQLYSYSHNRRPNQAEIMRSNAKKCRKLTQQQADKIRERIVKGEKIVNLAKEFKVHKETISRINRRLIYTDKSIYKVIERKNSKILTRRKEEEK